MAENSSTGSASMLVRLAKEIVDRSCGYMNVRLYSAPKVDRHHTPARPPRDEHERASLQRAHEVSECAIFDSSGNIIMVIKAQPTAGKQTSVRVGIKTTDDFRIEFVKELDEDEKKLLAEFHASHNGKASHGC